MIADDTRLAMLAGAILDGQPIDWDAADSSTQDADRPLLARLRQIAALAEAHRADMPETWGPLRILERIGKGAFGEVYRAWDSRLDREVALKLLPADDHPGGDLSTSIIEEGRLLARLHHPNVVTIYGAERIQGRVGLWMEYITGQTLHQMVTAGRRFTPTEVVRIGREICSAAAAVHAAGLLHRDIKAQNVMMSGEGRVVLMDFGAGRDRADAERGGIAGTPLYLAPEILARAGNASVQAEIYSIGVVLFFLLTGSYPVQGRNFPELRAAHQQGTRTTLKSLRPDLPRRLCLAVERAIDPDARRRYQTSAALESALASVESRAGLKRGVYAAAAASLALAAFFTWSPTDGRAVPASPQLAVLPLTTSSGDSGDEQLADGLTEEIIRSLGTIQGLHVRSRTSSFAFKNRERDLEEIRRRLGVDYVVEGSVVRAGGQLIIYAELLEVEGQRSLWSNRFERELTASDIHTIPDDISSDIAGELGLRPESKRRRYATNLQTYETYLRARSLAERRGNDTMQAVQLFNKVIQADRLYTPAYAGLVLAYAYMSMLPYQTVPFETAHAIMKPAAIKAVELDPDLAEAHAARGWVHARDFEWAAAEAAFRRALELNPNLTFIYTSFSFCTLRPLGKTREAEALIREAAHIDPYSGDVQRELAQVLLELGRTDEAIEILEAIRLSDSDLPFVDVTLGRALALAGRIDESLPLLERRRERLVEPESGVHPWVSWAYMKAGRRVEVEELARRNDHLPFRRAVINGALGNLDRMFQGLEEMAEREPQRLALVLRSPEFGTFRADERYRKLLRRLNLPD